MSSNIAVELLGIIPGSLGLSWPNKMSIRPKQQSRNSRMPQKAASNVTSQPFLSLVLTNEDSESSLRSSKKIFYESETIIPKTSLLPTCYSRVGNRTKSILLTSWGQEKELLLPLSMKTLRLKTEVLSHKLATSRTSSATPVVSMATTPTNARTRSPLLLRVCNCSHVRSGYWRIRQ